MDGLTFSSLLSDDSFVSFCLTANRADVEKWQQYITQHPEDRALITSAMETVRMSGWILDAQRIKDQSWSEIQALMNRPGHSEPTTPPSFKRAGVRKLKIYLAAAAALLILCVSAYYLTTILEIGKARQIDHSVYTTGKDFRKGILLPDSSFIILSKGSELKLDRGFGAHQRRLALTGTAFFKVAKDSLHPFSVRAGDHVITALGTAFRVDYHKGRLNVMLEEGKVKVEHLTGDSLELTSVLHPGDQLSIQEAAPVTGPVITKSTFQPTVLDKWKKEDLDFSATPLPEVFRQLEICYNIHINAKGLSLNSETFSGHFKNDRLTAVLDVLCFSIGKQYTITDSTNIKIY